MKQKESYELEELYDNLDLTLTELSKQSGLSHGTLTRIRDGVPARRSTVNKLLKVFSSIYGVELSIDNVKGIALEAKGKHEKEIKPPVLPTPIDKTAQPVKPQNRTTEPKKKKQPNLPEGAILAIDFARNHGLPLTTFRDHMLIGLGPGVPWGMG